jgi:hypothetical protein
MRRYELVAVHPCGMCWFDYSFSRALLTFVQELYNSCVKNYQPPDQPVQSPNNIHPDPDHPVTVRTMLQEGE